MTLQFRDWTDESNSSVGIHTLRILDVKSGCMSKAESNLASALKFHYDSPEHIARVLKKLGKPGLSKLLKKLFPTKPELRLGELGEIIATEYIEERTNFHTPIKRLQYKDHKNMAMRGDDVIGFEISMNKPIRFLKVEVKSRQILGTEAVKKARKTLKKDKARPSGHSLNFISNKLISTNEKLSDAIDEASLKNGIKLNQVSHMIFTFSENAPDKFLNSDLIGYTGRVPQKSVGLSVPSLVKFVRKVYDEGVGK